MRLRSSACWAYSAASTSPTVAPSAWAEGAPPTASRSWVGSLTVTAMSGHRPGACERLVERVERRGDLRHLEALADRVERLQPVAGDVGDHALVGVDVAARGELGQHRGGHAAGGLGEDAG